MKLTKFVDNVDRLGIKTVFKIVLVDENQNVEVLQRSKTPYITKTIKKSKVVGAFTSHTEGNTMVVMLTKRKNFFTFCRKKLNFLLKNVILNGKMESESNERG